MPDEKRFVPDFQLVVDGTAADPELKGAVLGIRVTDDIDRASRFWLHLSDAARRWTRQGRFKPGTAIEIQLGYQGALKSVCRGEVSGLEVVLDADAPTRLIVSGVDKGHGFDKGTVTRTNKEVKDSDLASAIAQRHGLSAEVDDSQVVHDYVIQNNLSDYDFLMQRAAVAGFRVYVDGGKLLFRKPRLGDPPAARLIWRENIGRFVQEVNTFGQVSRITTSGWDPKQARQATGPGKGGDEYGKQGGTVSGAQLVRQMFGEIEQVMTVASGEKNLLEAIAKSEFNRRAGVFVHAEARVTGDPSIRAGSVVEVEKAGKRVDGEYYVVSSDHVFFVDTGYATELRAKRYTIRKGSPPAKDVGRIAREAVEAAEAAEEIAKKIEDAAAIALKAAREAARRAAQALEAARQIREDVKSALDEVKSGSGDVARTALKIVDRRLPALADYIGQARSKVEEAAQEAKAAQRSARAAFAKAHEAAAQVTGIAASAIAHARDAFDAVKAAALDAGHTTGEGLSAGVSAYKKSALAAADTAVSTGKAGIAQAQAAIAKGKSAIETCATSGAQSATPLVDGLGADLAKTVETVKASGEAADKSIGAALSAGAQHAIDAAKESIRHAQDAIGKSKQALQDAAETIAKNVGERLQGLVGEARSVVSQAGNAVDGLKQKLEDCRKKVEEVVDRCGGKWIEAGRYLKEHAGNALQAGKSCYGHIRSGISLLEEKKWKDAREHVDPAQQDFGTARSETQVCADKLEEVEKDLPEGVRHALQSVAERARAMLPHGESALSKFVAAVEQKLEPVVEDARRACEIAEAAHDAICKEQEKEKDAHEQATKGSVAQVKERYGAFHDSGSRMQAPLGTAVRKSDVSIDQCAAVAIARARGAVDEIVAAGREAKASYDEAGRARAAVDEVASGFPAIREHLQSAFELLTDALGRADQALERVNETLSAHEKEIAAEAEKITSRAQEAVNGARSALDEARKRMERNKALFRGMPARKGASDAMDAAAAAVQSAAGAAESAMESAAQARGTALAACSVPGDSRVADDALAAIAELAEAAKKAEETAAKAEKAVGKAAQGDGAGAKRDAGEAKASQAATASAASGASASAQRSQGGAAKAQTARQSPREATGPVSPAAAGSPSAAQPRATAPSAASRSGPAAATSASRETSSPASPRSTPEAPSIPQPEAASTAPPEAPSIPQPEAPSTAASPPAAPDIEAGIGAGAAAAGAVASAASAVETAKGDAAKVKDDAAKAKDDAAKKREEVAGSEGAGESADVAE